jgi:tetratricopeptide (TPR) repeat protein
VLDLESWDEAPWAMDVVQSLVDQSMLRIREPRPGYERFGLYESIREYAAEKLAVAGASMAPAGRPATGPEAVRAAHGRHAEHYAAFGTEEHLASLSVHGGVERGRLLEMEMENLVAAVDRSVSAGEAEIAAGACLAAMEVIELTGPFLAGAKRAGRVLEVPGLDARQQTMLLQKRGRLLHLSGRSEESLRTLETALAKAREERSRRHEGIVLSSLGTLHRLQGRPAEAREHYEAALAIHREVGNRRFEGTVLGSLGVVHLEQGRPAEAREHHEAALAIHREVGDRRHEGIELGCLGILHQEQGRPDESREPSEAALDIAREVGDRRSEGAVLGSLGILHQAQGRLAEAREHYEAALDINREVGNRRGEGVELGNLGDLLLVQGETEAAETRLTEAMALCDEVLPSAAGAFRGSLALLRARQGAFDEARALLTRGDQQLRGVYALELGKLLCKRGEVERLAGDLDAARAARDEAASIAAETEAGSDSDLGRAVAALRDALDQ